MILGTENLDKATIKIERRLLVSIFFVDNNVGFQLNLEKDAAALLQILLLHNILTFDIRLWTFIKHMW